MTPCERGAEIGRRFDAFAAPGARFERRGFPARSAWKDTRMEWWVILLIVAGVVVVLAFLLLGGRRAREGRLESRRAEAGGLRRAAQSQTQRAEERQRVAEEQAEQARRDREAAQARLERADDLDPDVDR
jgi:hypothetical protein